MPVKTRASITFVGVVQGVGFRPTLYNYAKHFAVVGEIRNFGSLGVRATFEGERATIEKFLQGARAALPAMAYLESIDVQWEQYKGEFHELQIEKSAGATGRTIVLPPDIATCDACLTDLRNSKHPRYYRYPFIACAECGPRFTTMDDLPYDRERSTMVDFPLCPACQAEYKSSMDRRFHAQTFACHTCGPKFSIYTKTGDSLASYATGDVSNTMAQLLLEGNILAVKGIGGVHLICRADQDDVLLKLRTRKKRRKYKPFAVMVRDIAHAGTFVHVDELAQALLTSFRRPIVLLPKKQPFPLTKEVAPGLDAVGTLLPYMGLHHLLFDHPLPPLVFTSGNVSNLPMALENATIAQQLGSLADYFVLHDRRIAQRCDDSVVKIVADVPKLIRRSRGYVPEYFPLPFSCDAFHGLAFGPELHSTGAVLKLSRVFPTQHIGNVTNLETYDFLNDSLNHLLKLLGTEKQLITFLACDLHPAFHSSRLANEWAKDLGIDLIPVQHHHAHHAAVLADNQVQVDNPVISITVDGVGYGPDKSPWGGEVLAGPYSDVERKGHLMPIPMPGGDLAARFPGRLLLSICSTFLSPEEVQGIQFARPLPKLFPKGEAELTVLNRQLKVPKDMPQTTSLGRILDALAVAFGVCVRRTYDGEPAMRFEAFANRVPAGAPIPEFEIPIKISNNVHELSTPALFQWLIEQKAFSARRSARHAFAYACHISIGRALAQMALDTSAATDIKKIGLTGGVALNQIISSEVKRGIRTNEREFLEHNRVPPGDAGISIGQCAVAAALALQKK